MKLFRASIKHKYDRNQGSTIYVMEHNIDKAISYLEMYLRAEYSIHKVVYLGDQNGRFFKRPKK